MRFPSLLENRPLIHTQPRYAGKMYTYSAVKTRTSALSNCVGTRRFTQIQRSALVIRQNKT